MTYRGCPVLLEHNNNNNNNRMIDCTMKIVLPRWGWRRLTPGCFPCCNCKPMLNQNCNAEEANAQNEKLSQSPNVVRTVFMLQIGSVPNAETFSRQRALCFFH
mmetsp:Transcript_2805/g.7543  ORF Transcript_2805/g.7543 Transcript_2805/m.7543 type:complete len:103 (-) Transcript_2805:2523-2831(-)